MKKIAGKILDYMAMWLLIAAFAWPEIVAVLIIGLAASLTFIF